MSAVRHDVLATLAERQMFEACTDAEGFRARAAKGPVTVYAGFDPSAPSLHIGNLVVIMCLRQFQLAGHNVIMLAGGGTGMIGDPSGKRTERKLLTADDVRRNTECVRSQLGRFLDFDGPNPARLVNNYDWLGSIGYIEMLRDVGKHFRIGDMLGKESVRARISSEDGISYTEFSYMILQAYDFLHLFRTMQCEVQCGGADQWGNITSGMELIRRIEGGHAFGVTFPLLLDSAGSKFGKSENGSVFLDPAMTSPYDMYQFWIRSGDAQVERLLLTFTELPVARVREIMAEHAAAPEKRIAQKALAEDVVTRIHGAEETRKVREAASVLFDRDRELKGLSGEQLAGVFADVPSATLPRADLEAGIPFATLLVSSGLCGSKKEAKRLLEQGGAYLNNVRIDEAGMAVTPAHCAAPNMLVLRAGKKTYRLVRFV
jgi:tyrosyl-tRNA synthetase